MYKSEHFDRYFTGFVYLHKTKKEHKHIEALNHLAAALNLSAEEQASHLLVSDGKAAIINAWRTMFPNMPQERCSLHFLKNIHDKLWYHLPTRPTKEQVKGVLSIFNGTLTQSGVIDLPAEIVQENEDKILHSM